MSKDHILTAIRDNRPDAQPLPEIPDFAGSDLDLEETFVKNATTAAINCFGRETNLAEVIDAHYPSAKTVVAPDYPALANTSINSNTPLAKLGNIDLLICSCSLGVAENGALWLPSTQITQRVLPFITQHLLLVLPTKRILKNMHQAYKQIDFSGVDFGVFIAGPSKTADIEQSLVIGAQGARSLAVVLV